MSNGSGMHAQTKLTAWILVVLGLFYFWPGAELFNNTSLVLGLPSTVFWFLFALPILNIGRAWVWYRQMWQIDAEFMAEHNKRKAA